MMTRPYSLLLLAAAALLAGCSKNEAPSGTVPGRHEVIVNAVSDPGELTRTAYAGDKTFSWSDGDQISVLFNNGSENKFYTLTATSVNGASATFSGFVDDGWTMGASDTGKKWALFPAADHVYTAGVDAGTGTKNGIQFNIPALTDFSASHFSANIPMSAIGDADNNFAFRPSAGAFKFSFTGIPDNVSKVSLQVTQLVKERALSGLFEMKNPSEGDEASGYTAFIQNKWADLGSPNGVITFVENVVDGNATFYIPFAGWDNRFHPELLLTDCATDDILYQAASKDYLPTAQISHLIVVPEIPVKGAVAWQFESKFGIDWSNPAAECAGRSDSPYDAIRTLKAASDASKLYLYFEVKKDALYDNDAYSHSNLVNIYLGDAGSTTEFSWQWTSLYTKRFEGWAKHSNAFSYITYQCSGLESNVIVHGDFAFYELSIPRSFDTCLSGSAATVAMEINQQYVESAWAGSNTQIGFAPATGGPAMEVPLQ